MYVKRVTRAHLLYVFLRLVLSNQFLNIEVNNASTKKSRLSFYEKVVENDSQNSKLVKTNRKVDPSSDSNNWKKV